MDDLHRQVVAWLVQNCAVMLLPRFATSQMVTHCVRCLHKKTVRGMMT